MFSLIFIHELGHFETARLLKFEVDKIYLYPTGGISKFTSQINVSWLKELLVLINGPLMQCITYLLLFNYYPYDRSLDFLKYIHYSILLFNLLPIYPLDGGKIINLILSLFFSYRSSFNITIIISYIIIIVLALFLPFYFKINYIFMILFLLYKVHEANKEKKYYFDKFLLERYLYSYSFNKICIVKSIKDFKRGCMHIINDKDGVFFEKDKLNKVFMLQKK
ncbi:MAG: hypothetical protein IKO49_07885 [Bacilli bacterium]|nr:hypothetical protein [Bacilli bacterium]